ncbi:hypothetical protein BJ944DRAFT_274067 [Cunninghamella echinulata]|nr:hypothetical protein BJ944DRAFT_274067 [Cunninghamella echinulata]
MEGPKYTPDMFQPVSEEVVNEWKEKLVGKYLLDVNEVRAELNDDQIVRRDTIPKTTRVLFPTTPCTMDYIPGRMNISIEEDKKITSVYFC